MPRREGAPLCVSNQEMVRGRPKGPPSLAPLGRSTRYF